MAGIKLQLPPRLNLYSLRAIAASWRWDVEEIEIDFSRQQFVFRGGTVGPVYAGPALGIAWSEGYDQHGRVPEPVRFAASALLLKLWHRPGRTRRTREARPCGGFSEIRRVTEIGETDEIASELVSVTCPSGEAALLISYGRP